MFFCSDRVAVRFYGFIFNGINRNRNRKLNISTAVYNRARAFATAVRLNAQLHTN